MLALLTVATFTHLSLPAGSYDLGHFRVVPFLAQLGVAAGYQISWAIYVSDYSRYLPADVPARRTFQWTFWGSALGGIWVMLLGSCIAAAAGKDFETITSIKATADKLFPGFGAIALGIAAIGLVSVTALNMYGGSLTLISSVDSLRRVRPTLTLRIITIGVTALISLVGANLASENFLANFSNFLLLVLYFFIPWTAVNLTDYFIVRKGHYAIAEIFEPNGHLRPLGLGRDHLLPRRLPRHGPLLLRRHPVRRPHRQGHAGSRHLHVHRPARGRRAVLADDSPHRRRGRAAARRAADRRARGGRP